MSVGTLLTVLGLLPGRARAMGSGDILFLLGLGLHLAVLGIAPTRCASEDQSSLDDIVYVCHNGSHY